MVPSAPTATDTTLPVVVPGASVLIVPSTATRRTPAVPSAISSTPWGSTATPHGRRRAGRWWRAHRRRSRPAGHWAPVPATVVIVPDGSILRTRRSPESAMYSDPSRPTASPLGSPSSAAVAGPPSPQGAVASAHLRAGGTGDHDGGSPHRLAERSRRRRRRSSPRPTAPCSTSAAPPARRRAAWRWPGTGWTCAVGQPPWAEAEHGAGSGGCSAGVGSRCPWGQPAGAIAPDLPSGQARDRREVDAGQVGGGERHRAVHLARAQGQRPGPPAAAIRAPWRSGRWRRLPQYSQARSKLAPDRVAPDSTTPGR